MIYFFLVILWLIIGFSLFLYTCAAISDEILLVDLFMALLGALLGPVMLIIAAPFFKNIVIWKGKQ